jgi:hypothetical protein
MQWERWDDPDVGQIYEVERRVGETLECFKRDAKFTFCFEATTTEAYDVFNEARYVRVDSPGGLATPVRPVEGGWEIWTDME